MKMTVDFDFTPEEARQFLGLPDVKPMQARVMEKLEQQMLEFAAAYSPDELMKRWFTLMPQGTERFMDMLVRFNQSVLGTEKNRKAEG